MSQIRFAGLDCAGMIVSAVLALLSATAAADQPYFRGIGDLPGARFSSRASGISADGLVIVGTAESPQGMQAFRWTAQTGMVGLGDLPGSSFHSEALAVSADGSVVVGVGISSNGPYGGAWEAFRWTAETGMVGLGVLPGEWFYSTAIAVSGDGESVFGQSTIGSGNQPVTFLWTLKAGMQPYTHPYYGAALSADGSVRAGSTVRNYGGHAYRESAAGGVTIFDDLPGGTVYCGANAISADGRVVVGWGTAETGGYVWPTRWETGPTVYALIERNGVALATSADGSVIVGELYDTHHGFRWTAQTGTVPIEELTVAAGVSADGSVIAGTANGSSDHQRAVRWTAGGGVESLGDLPGDRIASEARAVSADGTTVVGYGESDNGFEAFRWTAATGMQPLGLLPGSDEATIANAVSADGSVIVGESGSYGVRTAFRYTDSDGIQALESPAADSTAIGVSSDGAVIVGNAAYAAFRWTQSGGSYLGEVPGVGAGSAVAVSADGLTVVGTAWDADSPGSVPFSWTEAEGAVGLPDPSSPTGYASGFAVAVSSDGRQIVCGDQQCFWNDDEVWECTGLLLRWTPENGVERLADIDPNSLSSFTGASADGAVVIGNNVYCGQRGCIYDPFLWDAAHGVRPLKPLLVTLGVGDAQTWRSLTANGISADGRTIVGGGVGPAGREAWIAYLAWTGDVDNDLDVDLTDLAMLLAAFSSCTGAPIFLASADLDDSGCVDLADLVLLLGHYGT